MNRHKEVETVNHHELDIDWHGKVNIGTHYPDHSQEILDTSPQFQKILNRHLVRNDMTEPRI